MLSALLLPALALAQPAVITVDAAHPTGPYHPVWNSFGADEPNYTYTPNGAALLRELAAIAPATPVYFRPHNLLTSGDSTGALKWGSTNVYAETPDGTPVYDFTTTDRLFDNFVAAHIRPMVELGFMPEALSPHPTPYRHDFPAHGNDIWTGWSYPPKDYAKWRALIVTYARHMRTRYGAQVDSWQWEVWNEPDISYFHGTPQEYIKLYDITVGAVREVLPHAIVGGPGVTGSGENKGFLKLFLEHCARGVNADTGPGSQKLGAPLDFISFHPKGSPKFIAEDTATHTPAHVRMALARQLTATDHGFQIIAGFPEFRATPIILSETDPEGCAACKGPQNGYRNGTLYGVSVAEMLTRSAELARLRGVNLLSAVTWAFEFEAQPPFAGFRELASNAPLTNGTAAIGTAAILDKPVLNVFRLFGIMDAPQTTLLAFTSSAAIPLEKIASTPVVNAPDISGFSTRHGNTVDVLFFNYHDEDLPAPPTEIKLNVTGLPRNARIHLTRYVVDHDHANAYTAWQSMGSPPTLTPQQLTTLQTAAVLHPVEDRGLPAASPLSLPATLPRQAVTLYHLTW